ncbi:MAG: chemotaxis protein [Firmicutes bacterium]|nr:chemotaxis protein [[Eubacterium] siraeum]MCM1488481.1 chemotaxis protein [Bacillota bacterium]
MDTGILLESGTNELELLKFYVGDKCFGINIAKVSEMMRHTTITPMPDAPEAVEGIYMPRDILITVIDLHKVLKSPCPDGVEGMMIICEFNGMNIAFHVTSVNGIVKLSWTNIEKPPSVAQSENKGLITGVAKLEDGMILILDFEKIVADINRSAGLDTTGVDKLAKLESVDFSSHIVIAEDSALLNKMIMETLHTAGFKNIMSFTNGQDAFNYIESFRGLGENITDEVALLITDIEMPQMDGHHLTKRIKDDSIMKKIPVFLFSSLINEQMRVKGKSVGADEQFSKPQIGVLVETLYHYLSKDKE